MASARWVNPSANCFVVGSPVVRATALKWLAAETAHCAAELLMAVTVDAATDNGEAMASRAPQLVKLWRLAMST